MSELKRCPFCNGTAYIDRSHDVDGCIWSNIKCAGCGVMTKGKWVSNSADACPIFYAEVRDEWNRRAEDTQITQLKEQVEAMSNDFRAINGELTASLIEVKFEREELRAQLAQQPAPPIPDGWRLIEKKTCFVLARGNEIVANLAGPNAEEHAATIASLLAQQPASAVPDEQVLAELATLRELLEEKQKLAAVYFESWQSEKTYAAQLRAQQGNAMQIGTVFLAGFDGVELGECDIDVDASSLEFIQEAMIVDHNPIRLPVYVLAPTAQAEKERGDHE